LEDLANAAATAAAAAAVAPTTCTAIGVSGTMQTVRLMCLKILGQLPAGAVPGRNEFGANTFAVRAYDYASKNDVDVINNS
jgi:hypothetical protein